MTLDQAKQIKKGDALVCKGKVFIVHATLLGIEGRAPYFRPKHARFWFSHVDCTKKETQMTLDEVLALGFDNSDNEGGRIIVACSECDATCIQGVPCHEMGCRNQMHECAECENLVPKGCRLCDDCFSEAEFDYTIYEEAA